MTTCALIQREGLHGDQGRARAQAGASRCTERVVMILGLMGTFITP